MNYIRVFVYLFFLFIYYSLYFVIVKKISDGFYKAYPEVVNCLFSPRRSSERDLTKILGALKLSLCSISSSTRCSKLRNEGEGDDNKEGGGLDNNVRGGTDNKDSLGVKTRNLSPDCVARRAIMLSSPSLAGCFFVSSLPNYRKEKLTVTKRPLLGDYL